MTKRSISIYHKGRVWETKTDEECLKLLGITEAQSHAIYARIMWCDDTGQWWLNTYPGLVQQIAEEVGVPEKVVESIVIAVRVMAAGTEQVEDATKQ